MTMKLAIDGGRPVRKTPLSYGRQDIDESDIKAVERILRSDFLTQGPVVPRFEEAFAKAVGKRYAVAFANGTAALHGAYHALGLGPGDELLTSPMTFASTANAALFLGAKVRFADVFPENGLLDPRDALKNITKRTKAVCPIHYAGMLAPMPEILEIAASRDIAVVEDACHAFGAKGYQLQGGAFGDLGVFSFHPVKAITTGEGGMVVTDDKSQYEKMAAFRTHGIVRTPGMMKSQGRWFYEMRELGFNYRLTDFQCALGLSQLKRYPKMLARRRAIARAYDAFFAEPEGISSCPVPKGTKSAYHLYPVLVDETRLKGGRKLVFEALRAEGIHAQVHYIPVNAHPYYRKLGFDPSATPNALRFYSREISLPIFPAMSDDDIASVMKAVEKVVKAYRR
jgi:perosamine synthetase